MTLAFRLFFAFSVLLGGLSFVDTVQACAGQCRVTCNTGEQIVTGTCPASADTCCIVPTGGPTNPDPGGGPTNPDPGGGPTGPTPSMVTVKFDNIVGFSTVNDLLTRILSFLQGFIVTLAILFIVIGGFLYITSAGNDGQMETAKKCILGAVIGLALGIAAPAFLKEVYTILGTDTTIPNGVGTSLSILQIAQNVLSFLLTIIGIIAIIMLVIGGIMYLTAAGNEDQLDRGKKIVKYSIIGIFIALASLVLVRQVAAFFS